MKANALLLTSLIALALFAFTSSALKKKFKSIHPQNHNTEHDDSNRENFLGPNSTSEDLSKDNSGTAHLNHRPNRRHNSEDENQSDIRNHHHDNSTNHNNHEERHEKNYEHDKKGELKAFFKSVLEHFSNYTMRQIFNETNFHAEFSGENKTQVFYLNGTEVDFLQMTLKDFENHQTLIFVSPDGSRHNVTSKQVEDEFERAFIEGFESGMKERESHENENRENSIEFFEKQENQQDSQASESLNHHDKNNDSALEKVQHSKDHLEGLDNHQEHKYHNEHERNTDEDEQDHHDEEYDETENHGEEEEQEYEEKEDNYYYGRDDHEQNVNPLSKRNGKNHPGQESLNSSHI